MFETRSSIVLVILGSVLGLLSVLVPYVISYGYAGPHEYSAPLFPLLRNAWEKIQPATTALSLVCIGGMLGFVKPREWALVGVSLVVLFPVAAILEVIVDTSSHNLIVLEFVFYAILIGAPSLIGALLGSVIRSLYNKYAGHHGGSDGG